MAELTGTALLISQVTSTTPGDGKSPYLHLPGSGEGSMTVEELEAQAISVYGEASMPVPDNNYSPTVSEFLSWHTLEQRALLEYLVQQGKVEDDGEIVIGDGSYTIHVVMASDDESFYVLEHLQKRDFSTIPLVDQQKIVQTDTWLETVSVALDMVPTGAGTSDEARDEILNGAIKSLEEMIEAAPDGFEADPYTDQVKLLKLKLEQMGAFSETSINEQVSALQERFVRALAFYNSLDATEVELDEFGASYNADPNYKPGGDIDHYVIYDNWIIFDGDDYANSKGKNKGKNTREAYENLTLDDVVSRKFVDIISLDYNAKIKEGYTLFIEQEKRLAAIQQQKWELIQTGNLNGRQLDAPSLIAYLQLLTSLEKEAIVAMDTEEIEQMNQLLQDIAVFQDIVNETLSKFDPSKPNQKLGLLGLEDDSLDGLTLKKAMAVAMFTMGLAVRDHPIVALKGIELPTFEMIGFAEKLELSTLYRVGDRDNSYPTFTFNENFEGDDFIALIKNDAWSWNKLTKTEWDSIATRLSEVVTTLNKDVQTKQTDVTGKLKEKNQSFTLCNQMMQLVQSFMSKFSFHS